MGDVQILGLSAQNAALLTGALLVVQSWLAAEAKTVRKPRRMTTWVNRNGKPVTDTYRRRDQTRDRRSVTAKVTATRGAGYVGATELIVQILGSRLQQDTLLCSATNSW